MSRALMKIFQAIMLTTVLLWSSGSAFAVEKSDDLAFESFQKGREAYQSGDYLAAVDLFKQAIDQASTFTVPYYVWLGNACELAFNSIPKEAKADSLLYLKKSLEAFQIAFRRNRDPAIRHDMGKMKVRYALERAKIIIGGVKDTPPLLDYPTLKRPMEFGKIDSLLRVQKEKMNLMLSQQMPYELDSLPGDQRVEVDLLFNQYRAEMDSLMVLQKRKLDFLMINYKAEMDYLLGRESDEIDFTRRQQVATAVRSLRQLWGTASSGLDEIWEAILSRERKERLYASASAAEPGVSDTLQAYLSVYIENGLNLVETGSEVDFEGMEPDLYIPKIVAACDMGQKSRNPEWFSRIFTAVNFDGGQNMRSAIYRIQGLRQSAEKEINEAIETFQKALSYTRGDTSQASLYLDMAFAAYLVDLSTAVKFSRKAYQKNPSDQRTRNTYGGLSLSLANARLDQKAVVEAIDYAYRVTTFGWDDRGEALMTLATAYLHSDAEDALDKAYVAVQEAYQIDADRYWKELRRLAELKGEFAYALDLMKKHEGNEPLVPFKSEASSSPQ